MKFALCVLAIVFLSACSKGPTQAELFANVQSFAIGGGATMTINGKTEEIPTEKNQPTKFMLEGEDTIVPEMAEAGKFKVGQTIDRVDHKGDAPGLDFQNLSFSQIASYSSGRLRLTYKMSGVMTGLRQRNLVEAITIQFSPDLNSCSVIEFTVTEKIPYSDAVITARNPTCTIVRRDLAAPASPSSGSNDAPKPAPE
jgi:hypothetical protein